MRTIEVKLYQFDELETEQAKDNARYWYRSSDEFDVDCILDEFVEVATACGFCLQTRPVRLMDGTNRYDPVIHFEIGGRGENASFDGSWSASRVDLQACKVIAENRPLDTETLRILSAFQALAVRFPDATGTASSEGRSRYQSADFDTNSDEVNDAECDFSELVKALAEQLQRALSAEYEYQNSDEYVDDCIRANEYEFTADGTRA